MRKAKYAWNIAYNFIMDIKEDYINRYGDTDNYSVKDMASKLSKYQDFLKCVDITVFNQYNLFKYSLVKGGEIDIYTNQQSIYREMRSLVIDMKNDEIVLCPFKKFFNINEIEETNIAHIKQLMQNAHNIEIVDKLDGSMQAVRYYNGEYFMSGSQALDEENSFRLKEGKEWLNNLPYYKQMIKDNPNYTFIFEYISKKDKHIVNYQEHQQGLYLIGARDITNGKQLSYYELANLTMVAEDTNIRMPIIEETQDIFAIMNLTNKYSGDTKEGWVLYIDGKMFKLKCDDYVSLHKIVMCNSSPNVVLKAVQEDNFDDILSKIPTQFRQEVIDIRDNIMKYIQIKSTLVLKYYDIVKNITDIKDFAIFVNKMIPQEYRGYMFALKKEQAINYIKGVKYYQILEEIEKQ